MGFLLVIGGIVVLLDQFSKFLVLRFMAIHSVIEIIPGFFNLAHVHNTGAAFSLLAGADPAWRRLFFICMSFVGLGIISYAYRKAPAGDFWQKSALALLFGGALGNLIDRLRFGEVVDFLDVYVGAHHWPTFNVADSAITAGAVLLLFAILRGK
ncbi:MAG: signal peptidase II [Syntrophobacteraceae bacterium]